MLKSHNMHVLKKICISAMVCFFISTSAIAKIPENFPQITAIVENDNNEKISFIVQTIKDNIDSNLSEPKLRKKIRSMNTEDLGILYSLCSKSTGANVGPGADAAFAMISVFLIII